MQHLFLWYYYIIQYIGYIIYSNSLCAPMNAKASAFYLSRLSRARLSYQHKGLVTHQDFSKALSVFPDRQLQPLLQDLKVAWRMGQVGDGVDLLLNRALLEEASATCSWDAGHPE